MSIFKKQFMNNPDFTTTLVVDQTAKEVFDAVNNPRAWWSEEIKGSTNKEQVIFTYHYKEVHLSKIKIEELIADKKVVWRVLENYFDFLEDKTEWTGTRIIFDIMKEGDKTMLRFTHEGLVPAFECYKICNDAWSNFIQNSLRKLITTGKGQPNPKEGGFNSELMKKWNLQEG
jgi:hypothetical protein